MPASLLAEIPPSSNGENDGEERQHRTSMQQLALDLTMFGLSGCEEPDNSSSSSSATMSSASYKEVAACKTTTSTIGCSKRGGNMTECVCVPSSEHVAEIVGRQGCKIKALRAKTNTYIKTPVRGEEPVFVVTGRKEDVASAKREIVSAAEHFSQIRASRRQNSTGSSVGSLGPPSPSTPGQVTIQVRVPYRVVGLVVGPKGATIKRIQQQTHTYIVTPSRDKEPVFEVTGSADSVEKARHEIESHIALRTGGMLDPGTSAANNFAALQANANIDAPGDNFNDFHSNGIDAIDLSSDVLSSFYKPPSSNSAFTSYSSANSRTQPHQMPSNSNEGHFFTFPSDNHISDFSAPVTSFEDPRTSQQADNDEDIVSPSFDNITFSSVWSNMTESRKSFEGMFPSNNESVLPHGNTNEFMMPNAGDAGSFLRNDESPPFLMSAFAPLSQSQVSYSSSGASLQSSASSSPTEPSSSTVDGRRRNCMICFEGQVLAALVPCGHNMFCMSCASQLISKPAPQRVCPVCKTTPTQAIRIKVFS